MALFVSKDEIEELTGRTRYTAQQQTLTAMGIPFRVRHDNSPAVLYDDLKSPGGRERATEPAWPAAGKSAA